MVGRIIFLIGRAIVGFFEWVAAVRDRRTRRSLHRKLKDLDRDD